MIRKCVSDAKDPTQCGIAQVANVSPDDDRFLAILNLSTQNLVQTGEMFYGLHQKVQFCVTDGCISLPRQIAAIESAAVCDHPIPVRNRFFEWLETGIGLRSDGSCGSNSCGGNTFIDRGLTCAFSDIIPDSKKIKVYADIAEDTDAEILLQGLDDNGQWILTETTPGSGIWQDGEKVSINASTPQLSTKFFSSLVSVQKPVTNGNVRLYEYDTALATQRAIAIYEPDETRPSYKKMFLSGLSGHGCCGCTGDDEGTFQVTVMAKLEFIPVRRDDDWLMIGNFSALESEVQSILKRRNNLAEESLTWHAMAVRTLREELRHYVGRGIINPMRMQPRNLAGAAVRTLI